LARHAEELRSQFSEAQHEAEHDRVQAVRRLDRHAGALEESARAAHAETERRLAEALDERVRREVERLRREAEEERPRAEPAPSDAPGNPIEPAGSQEAPQAGPTNGPLHMNQVTVEDLRGLRLSLTQAKRLIDYRDQLGGFTSLEQLDAVAGLPKDVRTELKRHLSE
jgi:DNA uptake protein ComE-like DNA-binding protein